MSASGKPAVFLDRDGVLIENIPSYVKTWDEVDIYPYSTDSLNRLHAAGLPIFIVTNQSIVGRGRMTLDAIEGLHSRIMNAVDPEQVVAKSYLCPHAPEDECDCRKPLPGSLLQAAKEFNIDLSRSYMVGDAVSDVLAARAAGVTPIILQSGRGKAEIAKMEPGLATISENLSTAVDLILLQLS